MKSSHESKFAEWIGSKWVGKNRIINNFKINFMKKFFNKKNKNFQKISIQGHLKFYKYPEFQILTIIIYEF